MWYQSGTSIRRNTRHINVGDLAGPYGGQPARTTVWGKWTLRCKERSCSEERASRAAGELDCFSAHIHLREPRKSEDKVDKASIRKEVDSEEHYSAVEVDLPIVKEGIQT
ncbi:hypothetical protein B296_00006990 [Ensete ventricosum]|uniref:Uncharacterized protein n=1 Tax=Ensete ventricosum TaxID=4639 RepID=A0A426YGJ8_ENSVE|nr:hypothetical protein B296_00006990 [Ensete ventricosum]